MFPKLYFIINIYELSKPFFLEKLWENRKANFCCLFPLLGFFTFISFSCLLYAMLGLDFCDFDNFLFSGLSFWCHEALINLSPHLDELNLAATSLTHLKMSMIASTYLLVDISMWCDSGVGWSNIWIVYSFTSVLNCFIFRFMLPHIIFHPSTQLSSS